MCKIGYVLIALWMMVVAYRDLRTKQISCLALLVMSFFVLVFRIVLVKDTIWSTLGGVLVGAGFFLISKWSKEAIGYGDSFLILLLGIFLGGKILLEVVLFATLLASVFSLGVCMIRGWNKKYTIPFAPFLTLAYMGVVFL